MLTIFFNLCFLLLIVVFGFGDKLQSIKTQNHLKTKTTSSFFIFVLLSASNLCSVFSLFHIFLSFLAFTFQETKVSSHVAFQQVVLPSPTQILMCTSHFFQDFVCSSNQFYCSPNSLLEFQFSFDLEFDLLRLKLLIYAQYVQNGNLI